MGLTAFTLLPRPDGPVSGIVDQYEFCQGIQAMRAD